MHSHATTVHLFKTLLKCCMCFASSVTHVSVCNRLLQTCLERQGKQKKRQRRLCKEKLRLYLDFPGDMLTPLSLWSPSHLSTVHLQFLQFPQSVDHAGQRAIIYMTTVALMLITLTAAAVYIWRRKPPGICSTSATGCIESSRT